MHHRQSLDEAQREALIGEMKDQEIQWIILIPKVVVEFYGKDIALSVLKRYPVEVSYQHPPLNNDEISLLKLIIANLPAIISQIEAYFEGQITPQDPMFVLHADEPTISVSRDQQIEKGADWWTFYVGRDDDPEPHWYFDFRQSRLVDAYHVR